MGLVEVSAASGCIVAPISMCWGAYGCGYFFFVGDLKRGSLRFSMGCRQQCTKMYAIGSSGVGVLSPETCLPSSTGAIGNKTRETDMSTAVTPRPE